MELTDYWTSFSRKLKYAYGVGRIRALEKRLLTKGDFAKLLEAKDNQEALRHLGETDYSQAVLGMEEGATYEVALGRKQGELLTLIQELSLDPEVTDTLRDRYDFHNLKVLLKARLGEEDLDGLLLPWGREKVDALKETVFEGEYREILPHHVEAIKEAFSSWEENQEPGAIDLTLDRCLFSYLLTVFKMTRLDFLSGWAMREVDLLNLRTFARLKLNEAEASELKGALVEGGSLEPGFFLGIFAEPWETLPSRFANILYHQVVEGGLAKGDDLAPLERACRDYILSYLKKARLTPFGIEPIYAFLLVKEEELRSVRAVLLGKKNGLDPQLIKERLPSDYL